LKPNKTLRRAAALALLVAVPVAVTATVASLATAPKALAADHLDGPQATMDPAADITDVYSFMDGTNVVLVLNVAPQAMAATSKFSDKIQYVIHTESTDAFEAPGQKQDIIATFSADQKISLWIGSDIYLTGDASATTGLASADGKVKVFAGLRDDPFFFNFEGFTDAADTVASVAAGLTYDEAKCPTNVGASGPVVAGMLAKTNKGADPAEDFFAGLNVLSIVIQVDKTILNKGGPLLALWGSTNKGL